MLRDLGRLGAPAVRPLAVITGRRDAHGEELTAALVTEHLEFSLPYRAVFSRAMRAETATHLIDSLAVLLVRLHLLNFYWGDVSLSNTLFRRDADAFSGYLVDAETGDLQPELSQQRRLHDVEVARVNIIGELMDLQAGSLLPPEIDAIGVGNEIVAQYERLWDELTKEEILESSQAWRIQQRIERLNRLGFDVGELSVTREDGGQRLRIRPHVVDAGHHHRALMRLTGMDVQEGQARRILNAITTYSAVENKQHLPAEQVAHEWISKVFEPTVAAVPSEYAAKLEPAQIFHEVLEHQWYLSEAQNQSIPLAQAVEAYVRDVLPHHRDEALLLEFDPSEDVPED